VEAISISSIDTFWVLACNFLEVEGLVLIVCIVAGGLYLLCVFSRRERRSFVLGYSSGVGRDTEGIISFVTMSVCMGR